MKKIVVLALIFVTVFSATSCSRSLDDKYPKDLVRSSSDADHSVLTLQQDWPSYETADEIVTAASNIYSGKVSEISFAIVDMKTGRIDEDPESSSTSRMLYTVYTVEVDKNYKGDNPALIKICKTGGIDGYKVKEQYDLMKKSGMTEKYSGIPVCNDDCSLAVGSTYLFCTSRTAGDFDFIINPTQFAHSISSNNAKAIINSCK